MRAHVCLRAIECVRMLVCVRLSVRACLFACDRVCVAGAVAVEVSISPSEVVYTLSSYPFSLFNCLQKAFTYRYFNASFCLSSHSWTPPEYLSQNVDKYERYFFVPMSFLSVFSVYFLSILLVPFSYYALSLIMMMIIRNRFAFITA